MVRSTDGLHTAVGRSLHGAFRPYRTQWRRHDQDEDPWRGCKVQLDRMVNAGRTALSTAFLADLRLKTTRANRDGSCHNRFESHGLATFGETLNAS